MSEIADAELRKRLAAHLVVPQEPDAEDVLWRMLRQLEGTIAELERKHGQLEQMIRRLGTALSAGLEPQGVVELTVHTALDGCGAEASRAIPLDPRRFSETSAGASDPALIAALEEVERAAVSNGPEVERVSVHALSVPLRAFPLSPRTSDLGVVSIARRDRPFTLHEQEILEFLAVHTSVSIENADLYATLQRQAVTDQLTGLSTRRQMDREIDRELDRRRRFGTPIGLVLLDIDDLKQANDRYGHPQGNEVLSAVAGVVRELSRDIDEPVRWGGEEFAVVLPQTDVEGAAELAERMRQAIERLRVPRLDGGGELHVTASFGVASVPESASDREELIEAALEALSCAKRAGKNRVERADDDTDDGPLT